MRILQTHAPAIFLVIVFILMLFRPFSTVFTDTICVRFCLDLVSRAFSNRCVFDENAQRICMKRGPKRIEMYAFSKGGPESTADLSTMKMER